jgi:hypothetical protein
MKKIMLSMALAITVLGTAFATPAPKEPSVIVKTAFDKEFTNVKDVQWEVADKEGVYEARFTFNNENLQAYFTEDGEFLGTTRQITVSRLPLLASNALARKYAGYHIVSVFEHSMPESVAYYITVSNAKGGLLLQATGNGELTVYKRIKQ